MAITKSQMDYWKAHRETLLAETVKRKRLSKKEQDAWNLGWYCATFMFAEQIMGMTGGRLKIISPEQNQALRDLLANDEPEKWEKVELPVQEGGGG